MHSDDGRQQNRTVVIRDPGYAERLKKACDDSLHCPPKHRGRLVWLADQVGKRVGERVTVQSVARWFNGEAKPRQNKNIVVAEVLGVNAIWLFLGEDVKLTVRERKLRNAMADGAVNVLAGIIQMDGGHPAFPAEGDERARIEHVDLYAIIKGANYAFHVALGFKISEEWEFTVPGIRESVINLGLIKEGFSFRVIELSPEILEAGKGGHRQSITVKLADDEINQHRLQSFASRL